MKIAIVFQMEDKEPPHVCYASFIPNIGDLVWLEDRGYKVTEREFWFEKSELTTVYINLIIY